MQITMAPRARASAKALGSQTSKPYVSWFSWLGDIKIASMALHALGSGTRLMTHDSVLCFSGDSLQSSLISDAIFSSVLQQSCMWGSGSKALQLLIFSDVATCGLTQREEGSQSLVVLAFTQASSFVQEARVEEKMKENSACIM